MADQTVGVIDQSGTGTRKVDTSELVVGTNTVERQRMVIADPVGAALLANVTAGGALMTDASATTQPVSGTIVASGTVSIAGTVAVSGAFWQATQPVSGTLTVNAGANLNTSALALDASVKATQITQGSATSGQSGGLALGAVTTAPPAYTSAQTSALSLTTVGALRVDGSGATQPVSGSVTATVAVIATATGAYTLFHLVSAATTNATSVKASAGRVYGGSLCNTSASAKYVKVYAKATAPTVGTDTPIATLLVPAAGTVGLAACFAQAGLYCANGIALAITGGAADTDTTAVALADVIVNLQYA